MTRQYVRASLSSSLILVDESTCCSYCMRSEHRGAEIDVVVNLSLSLSLSCVSLRASSPLHFATASIHYQRNNAHTAQQGPLSIQVCCKYERQQARDRDQSNAAA